MATKQPIQPQDAPFRNSVQGIPVSEVCPGDFIMVDIGPERNTQLALFGKVTGIVDNGDGWLTIITDSGDRQVKPRDEVAWLRPSR